VKAAARIALILGLGVMIVLIARDGAQSIMRVLSQAGWLLLLLVPLHAPPLLLDVMGWRVLIAGRSRVSMLFLIATIREAINRLLPVANVGGEIVGIRLLAQQGTDGTRAAASVIVELMITLITQFIFVALGVMCLLELTQSIRLWSWLLFGLAASVPLLALFIALLRNGSIFSRFERLAERLLGANTQGSSVFRRGADLDAAIRELFAGHGRLARALGWQLAGVILGCAETWLALRWLGHPVGFAAALAIESLTQAARHFVFIVPAGVGVQEAGLIALGHALGFDSDVAIALSLAKRMREILFGLPALAAWQWLEGRRGILGMRGSSG